MAQGLNLAAVFDLSALPGAVREALAAAADLAAYRQLILLGHGGRAVWAAMGAGGAGPGTGPGITLGALATGLPEEQRATPIVTDTAGLPGGGDPVDRHSVPP
jgi:hypothetical protein